MSDEQAVDANTRGYSSGFARQKLSPGDLASLNASLSGDGSVVFIDVADLVRAYRHDATAANRVFRGRRIMVRGVVRAVKIEDGWAFVTLGGPQSRDKLVASASLEADGEEGNARASHVGRLLAISCGDVMGQDPNDITLRDCAGFDP